MKFGDIDTWITLGYLVGIVGLGCWVGLRQRNKAGESRDYFLAGGTLTWPVIGLALFSTNISTIHLVALAQQGFDNGLAFGNFEWMATFTLILLDDHSRFVVGHGVDDAERADLRPYLEPATETGPLLTEWLAEITVPDDGVAIVDFLVETGTSIPIDARAKMAAVVEPALHRQHSEDRNILESMANSTDLRRR